MMLQGVLSMVGGIGGFAGIMASTVIDNSKLDPAIKENANVSVKESLQFKVVRRLETDYGSKYKKFIETEKYKKRENAVTKIKHRIVSDADYTLDLYIDIWSLHEVLGRYTISGDLILRNNNNGKVVNEVSCKYSNKEYTGDDLKNIENGILKNMNKIFVEECFKKFFSYVKLPAST